MKRINDFFGYDPDSDGSSDSGSDVDADGDTEMGGTETNEDVIKRVKALNDAYRAMPQSYPNPFPGNWKFT